jgi:hypothetical protein
MITVYVKPESLTIEQYDQVRAGLDASDADISGRKHHSCFGENGQLAVYEVWESEADYMAFTPFLLPLLEEAGIQAQAPMFLPVVNLDQ